MRQIDHVIAGGAGAAAARTHDVYDPNTGQVQAQVALGVAGFFFLLGIVSTGTYRWGLWLVKP